MPSRNLRTKKWIETLTFGSLDTDALWSDSEILLVGPAGQLIDTRDPSDSATPVDDAIADVYAAGGGEVYLPPGIIDDTGPVQPRSFVDVYGRGYGGNNATVVNITGGGRGLEVPAGTPAEFGALEGFRVTNGGGLGSGAGVGFYINDTLRQFDVRLRFDDWDNDVLSMQGGASYENNFERLHFQNCDAGAANALMYLSAAGPTNRFGQITAYPDDAASGADSKVYYDDGAVGDVQIEQMNLGQQLGWAVDRRASKMLHVGQINYEPNAPNTTPDRIIYNGVGRPMRVDQLRANAANVATVATHGYFLNEGRIFMGSIIGKADLSGDPVHVNTDITEAAVYEGVSTEVNNASGGALTAQVGCLGDLTTVS